MSPGSPDAQLLRRTAVRLGAQAAALVGIAVVALAGLAAVIELRAQHASTETLLRDTAAHADDVTDPPAGVWLTLRRAAGTSVSPGMPAGLPDVAALQAVTQPGARATESDLHRGDREFRVLTTATRVGVVQAALDLGNEHAERARLLSAMLAGGGLGLVLAVTTGTVLGRRAVRPLGDALALQRRFVADASHELRTPLTLLSTRAQLLQRDLADGGSSAGALRRDAAGVVADAHRLGEVVEDLLVAADPRVPVEPVDLGQLLGEVVGATTAYAAQRRVRLDLDVGHEQLVVAGHPAALRRALVALVDNAVEHSPPGGAVRLGCTQQDGRRVRITVGDDGPGLDPSRQRELLARFASGVHTGGRRHYGLGLALADEVAARHGGSLQVLPAVAGTGATVALVLRRDRPVVRARSWPLGGRTLRQLVPLRRR